jgi:hypothetical protein
MVICSSTLLVLLSCGCASVVNGRKQAVDVTSNPVGALIYVDGRKVGRTPSTLQLARKNEYSFRIEHDGYRPSVVNLSKKISAWYWGNFLSFGLWGLFVDIGNGAAFRLSPDRIAANLEPTRSSTEFGFRDPFSPEYNPRAISPEITAETLKTLEAQRDAGDLSDDEYRSLRSHHIKQLHSLSSATGLREIRKLKDEGLIKHREYMVLRTSILKNTQ